MIISVKVIPKARREEVVGWENDVLKVKVTAPPEKGEANRAVVRLLAKYFEVPQRKIVLLKGDHSRLKTFSIDSDF